jgi:hypothetical protein
MPAIHSPALRRRGSTARRRSADRGGASGGLEARGLGRVDQQHGDGHRADAAGNRRDCGRLLGHRVEVDVAHEPIVGAVGAHVDDHSALADHVRRHELGDARRRDEHVRPPADLRQVARLRVAHRHRGVARQQQRCEWPPHQLRAADHDRLGAAQLHAFGVEQLHHARRRARHEPIAALDQAARVDGGEAVDVLRWVDQVDHRVRIDALRQRQLQQDAADRLVGVERREQLGKLGLRRVGRQLVVERLDPGFGACLPLATHVDVRRRVVADDDRRQPGLHALGDEFLDLGLDAVAHLLRDSLAVDDSCAHFLFRGA